VAGWASEPVCIRRTSGQCLGTFQTQLLFLTPLILSLYLRSVCFGVQKNILNLPGIEPQIFSPLLCRLRYPDEYNLLSTYIYILILTSVRQPSTEICMSFLRDLNSSENTVIRLQLGLDKELRVFCRLDTLVFNLPTRILSFSCSVYHEHRNVGHKTVAK
jgi:hypothetical protein